jgi:tetratricopeptide (TPR) repeat protein
MADESAAHFADALALVARGHTRESTRSLERATALDPSRGDAWRLLGDIRLAGGDLGGAEAAYDQHLRASLSDPRLAEAADDLVYGRLEAASRALQSILRRDPSDMVCAHLLAETLSRQHRLEPALALLAECLRQAPSFHLARESLVLVLFGAGRFPDAVAQLDRLLDLEPGNHRARMVKAAALTEMSDFAAAAEITDTIVKDFPDQPHAWLAHGHGLRTLGRVDDAIAAWRRCLELDPAASDALWSLANLKTFRFTAAALAEIEARITDPTLGSADSANLHFTLGKAYEDYARHAEAFDHYARGAGIEHRRRRYDPNTTTTRVRRAKALFTPEFFAARAGWGEEAADPIFIVGLPRSGSTLVEQILASHSAIEGGRELRDIEVMAEWVGAQPEPLPAMPRDLIARLGRSYLLRTAMHRRLGRPHFTDKAPWNFLNIGLIHLLLPRARIIDARRHPLACCLSAFKQHFSEGFDFTYDLEGLGRYYRDYLDLMAHFDQVLPGRVHRVIHERLLDDTEGETRRMLIYLGLPFDPACLRFFDNPRPVATPSSEQVRRPISRDAAEQWRHFDAWLGPLKAALGPALETWDGG